jgi:hypothetical protein
MLVEIRLLSSPRLAVFPLSRMQQPDTRPVDFYWIVNCGVLLKYVDIVQFWLKSGNNSEYQARKSVPVYVPISTLTG